MFVLKSPQEMENQLTPTQSLDVINQMIAQAKRSFQKTNFYFLLWGALLAGAGVIDHVLRVNGIQLHWLVWPVASGIGGVASAIYGSRESKARGVSTVMDRVQSTLWGSFGVTLILVIVGTVASNHDPNPYVLLLTGLPTYASGVLIRFRPLMIGGVIFWAFGIVSVFYLHEYTSLVFALAVGMGYLIPGLMLKRRENAI